MYITQDYDEALARTESVESLQIESVLSLFSDLIVYHATLRDESGSTLTARRARHGR
jgi:hypothetical protein